MVVDVILLYYFWGLDKLSDILIFIILLLKNIKREKYRPYKMYALTRSPYFLTELIGLCFWIYTPGMYRGHSAILEESMTSLA